MKRPSIFEYIDYRRFLHDMFCFKKTTRASYSYRAFSAKAGFSSPNFLKLVIDGRRNLTTDSLSKMAKGFNLKKQEREFFENLVNMNQAAEHEQRDYYYRKMIGMKTNGKMKQLAKAAYAYFSRWYYPAIRELIAFQPALGAEEIAAALNPAITTAEATRALSHLEALGLVRTDSEGRWEQVDTVLTTGREVESILVANFHKQMMALASESIDRIPAQLRDISAVTLGIDAGRLLEIKERIALFRQTLMSEFTGEADPDAVVQINIQMFPLTHISDKGELP